MTVTTLCLQASCSVGSNILQTDSGTPRHANPEHCIKTSVHNGKTVIKLPVALFVRLGIVGFRSGVFQVEINFCQSASLECPSFSEEILHIYWTPNAARFFVPLSLSRRVVLHGTLIFRLTVEEWPPKSVVIREWDGLPILKWSPKNKQRLCQERSRFLTGQIFFCNVPTWFAECSRQVGKSLIVYSRNNVFH